MMNMLSPIVILVFFASHVVESSNQVEVLLSAHG